MPRRRELPSAPQAYVPRYATARRRRSGAARGAPADAKLDLPFAMCAARSKSQVVVLDAGYVNQKLGEPFGARDYVEYAPLLAEVGIALDEVDFVTLSHLHFDHAGGTSRFPKAKFIMQKRELEFAAAAMPHNSAARNAFTADDVLAAVQLNWQGRVLLADGDVEDLVPGLDVYLTPGHTAGTMTACLDTPKRRVCYSSDAVYTYRNLDEDIRSVSRSTRIRQWSLQEDPQDPARRDADPRPRAAHLRRAREARLPPRLGACHRARGVGRACAAG